MRTISILVSLAFVVFLAGNALAVNEEAVTVKAATPKEPAVSTAEPFGPPMILEQTGGTMECPPPEGTAKDGDQDGDGVDDWKLKSETDCDGNKVEIYCIDKGGPGESYFVYVYSGTKYVGKCPFEGGKNTFRKEKDGDGNWEETGWDSVDKGEEDDDGDGKEDDWHWVYDVATNTLKTEHTEDSVVVGSSEGPPPEDDDSLCVVEDKLELVCAEDPHLPSDSVMVLEHVLPDADTCLANDDGVVDNAWAWLPGLEYPDFAHAAKHTFPSGGVVEYVDYYFSNTESYPGGSLELFVWREDPNNPGYPLEPPIYWGEEWFNPPIYWPDYTVLRFILSMPVDESENYFFGHCNRDSTVNFICIDQGENHPDRNLYKSYGVWYIGNSYDGDYMIRPCLVRAGVMMTCEAVTPIFCRGKNFYFKLTVTNNTEDNVSGTLTFSGYAGYDCNPGNLLVAIPRSRNYAPGTTEQYYFFQVPNTAAPGQYSTSIDGTLDPGSYDVSCCMNVDIIQCGPFRTGENTEWDLVDVGREEVEAALPVIPSLAQNYPNPFNEATNISYTLAEAGKVSLKVYDISGRLVEVLVDQHQEAGEYTVTWDASEVSSGVYFYKLSAGDYALTKKMNLLR